MVVFRGQRQPETDPVNQLGGGNLSALLVTADSALNATVSAALMATDWRCDVVSNHTEAWRNLRNTPRKAVLIDQAAGGGQLDELIYFARRQNGPDTPIVAFLHQVDRALATRLVRAGISFFAAKPADPVWLSQRLSEMVVGCRPLVPFPEPDDPLARPIVVVATRSLELPRQMQSALDDEMLCVHYDGTGLPHAATTAASLLVVDDGMPNGLATLFLLRAVYGAAPAIALMNRGFDGGERFVATLTKPVRDASVRRQIRQLLGRVEFGLTTYPGGVVVRMREQWNDPSPFVREGICAELRTIAQQAKETRRKWICLEVGPIQDVDTRNAIVEIRKAMHGFGLHVGVATVTGDVVRTAMELTMHKELVHTSSASFIKLAQDLA